MKLARVFAAGCALVFAIACNSGQEPPPQGDPGAPPTSSVSPPATSASSAAEPRPAQPAKVKIPFAYPHVRTTAEKGDYVLAPPRAWIDEALKRGADKQTIIYYGAFMQEPGRQASLIRTRPGPNEAVPNSLIIPIRRAETAAPGDIVLTSWASGSGMQRAIVVEGGRPDAPKVRYLDLALDHPSGWGKRDDNLPPNTFHKLTRPGEAGSSLACQQGTRKNHYLVTSQSGDKILGLNYAGQLKVLQRTSCLSVPLLPEAKQGETVFVPVIGSFTEAQVTDIDAKIGRVFVKYEFAGEKQEGAFAFTNVATELE